MRSLIKPLISWHAKLSLRERILVGFGTLAAIWMLWLFAVWDVLVVSTVNEEAKLRSVQSELLAVQQNQDSTASEMARQKTLEADVATLSREIEAERQALEEAMSAFVDPEEISEVLRDVLVTNKDVKLIALKSQPPKTVSVGESVVFFQHPLVVELEGTFSSIYAYLREVEARSEVISFHSLEYKVLDYPLAAARINLSTVSRSKEWLGV